MATKTVRFRQGTKIGRLHQELRKLALSKGPGAKLPTRRELCEFYGVSPNPLNDALSDLESQNIIYRRQGSGIFVSHKIDQKLMLVLLDSSFFRQRGDSPYWGMLWGHMAHIAQTCADVRNEVHQFHLVTTQSGPNQELSPETLDWLERGNVDVVIDIGLHDKARLQIRKLDIPCVSYAAFGLPQVTVDDAYAIELGVRSLVRQGCSRIGLWRPARQFQIFVKPGEGEETEKYTKTFRGVIDRLGVEYHPELVRDGDRMFLPGDICTESSLYQGHRVALEVLNGPRELRPDGVFIVDDVMTAGVFWRFQELGLRSGTDFRIASIGNVGSGVLVPYEKSIAVVESDPEELAQRLFQVAEMLIEKAPIEPSFLKVRPRLKEFGVVREET